MNISKTGCMFAIFALFLIMAIVSGVGLWYKQYTFDYNCGGHLKRAADSNTIAIAEKELAMAIEYMEEHGLTRGNSSYIFPTPANDVEFWYGNIVATHAELVKLNGREITPLEQSNLLMKLRETLLDDSAITLPAGIAVYPHRWFWTIVPGFFFFMTGVTFVVMAVEVLE